MTSNVYSKIRFDSSSYGILDALPNFTVIVDKSGLIVFANTQALSVSGYAPQELVGLTIDCLIPERYREAHSNHFQANPRSRPMGTGLTFCIHRKDGTECPVEISLSPIETDQGKSLICVIHDISERKKTELAFMGDERFKLFMKYIPSAVAMFDCQMRYLAFSSKWLLDYQLGDKDITGLSHYAVFPDLSERWKEIHQRCLAGEVLQAEAEPFLRADGRQDWVSWKMHPWHTASGEIGGAILFTEVITKRKELEQSKRKSDERFREIFDHAVTGIAISDMAGYFQLCNPAFSSLLGYSPEELCQMNFSSRIHPSDQESTLVLYSRLLSRELPFFETENRYLTKSSQPVWVQKFISKLPDETGEPSHLLMLVTDITCRKQFEEELRDSHALNTSILNSLTSHIAVLDERGVIVTVNNAWRQFAAENGLSSTCQGLIGVNYLDVCKNASHQPNGEEANAAYTGIMAVLAGERKLFELEYPCHSPHRQRWFHMKVSPLEGFRRGVVVSHENITERKQAKQKLREKERMLSESQRIAHIGSWILDLKTGYISWSDEMYRICGITKEAFRHTPEAFMALIHPEDAAEMKRWINDCVNGRKMQELDFRIIWPDGTIRFIRCSGELEYDAMNVAIRAMGSAQDITERTYREQEAKKHLNELAHVARLGLMGEMASGMAHELKQPLAAISTYAQACLTFINVEKPDLILLAATLSKMQRQASRAGLIISRMREFAKSDVKRRATADINALIITCVELCNTEIKQSNIALTVELDENLPSIHVDHIQIEQVLINLIRNGIDALNSVAFQTGQRLLAIHSRLLPNRRIEVRIKDNGPGINEEQKQKILMPFYTTKSEGLGMGLSISRSLIEAHDGTLHFNSELAKGTSFYFTLPTQCKSN